MLTSKSFKLHGLPRATLLVGGQSGPRPGSLPLAGGLHPHGAETDLCPGGTDDAHHQEARVSQTGPLACTLLKELGIKRLQDSEAPSTTRQQKAAQTCYTEPGSPASALTRLTRLPLGKQAANVPPISDSVSRSYREQHSRFHLAMSFSKYGLVSKTVLTFFFFFFFGER